MRRAEALARSPSRPAVACARTLVVAAVCATVAACTLSTSGLGTIADLDDAAGIDASDATVGGSDLGIVDAGPPFDAISAVDSSTGDAVEPIDASSGDASMSMEVADAPETAIDVGPTCDMPIDGGIVGTADLSTFTFAGNASWNENGDGRITLTNSNSDEAGAAWRPASLPEVCAYDLTWTFRVGPGDTAGDGIAYVVLATSAAPTNSTVGDNGDGLGLRGLSGNGYAIAVDMYGTTEIRIVSMPSYATLVSKANGDALNDGSPHAVDVHWSAPSTLTATLHSTSGDLTVTSSDASLAVTGTAWVGFTAATGGGSNSHNEVAGFVVTDASQ